MHCRDISTGPFTAGQRTLTPVVYVEFSDQDVRNAVFLAITTGNLSMSHGGAVIRIKRALPKKIRGKIWVIKEVEKMVQGDPRSSRKEVTSVFENGERHIKVTNTVVFTQGKNTNGHFLGDYVNLVVPTPK